MPVSDVETRAFDVHPFAECFKMQFCVLDMEALVVVLEPEPEKTFCIVAKSKEVLKTAFIEFVYTFLKQRNIEYAFTCF